MVTDHPHFCASDTLMQGLETQYGRISFGYMGAITTLINLFYKDFINNPQSDMQLFLTISNIIRGMKEPEIKKAFRFNISDIVESIKLLILMNADSNLFNKADLSVEQNYLIIIYEEVITSEYYEGYKKLALLNKEDYISSIISTLNEEIKWYFGDNRRNYIEKSGAKSNLNDRNDGLECLRIIIDYLNKLSQSKHGQEGYLSLTGRKKTTYKRDLDRANYLYELLQGQNFEAFNKIIVHGVHKITPIMFHFFKQLEKFGVEVIFLINYCKNLPFTYSTWKEVYGWCDAKFEYESTIDIQSGQLIGQSIAAIIEGKDPPKLDDQEVILFRNLTEFTDNEVAITFDEAGESISQMKTQYYAVTGESSNALLKMYYPDQFGSRHFLSYPIGQFILGIYSMWDFEVASLKIEDKYLLECAATGLYKSETHNIYSIYKKISTYFTDVKLLIKYYERIKELKTANEIINTNNLYNDLKMISFFNITLDEIDEFKKFIEFIEGISNELFKDSNKTVDFAKHFGILMEIISNKATSNVIISDTESKLIEELNIKMKLFHEGAVKGNIEDVKDAIAFYLSGSNKKDSSNWIVRNFEQIDGSVLLGTSTTAKYHHFALLSNLNMNSQNSDILTWPLSEKMFVGYTDMESAVPVITKCILEHRNFLKFSLFYGTFFSNKNIQLSFIQEENGREQTLYYLLKILNLGQKLFDKSGQPSFIAEESKEKVISALNSEKLSSEEKETFAICPFKFMINYLIKSPIEYSNEYHIKYFVSNFMFILMEKKYGLKEKDLKNKLSIEYENIRKLFPFWGQAVLYDLEKNTYKQIIGNNGTGMIYRRRKLNFLIAQWKDDKTKQNTMNFSLDNINMRINKYMESSKLYQKKIELPHKKVCENCNFTDVCLRNYYEVSESMMGDE
ncbi:MAG: hypothetical protein WCF96_05515 [Eubacteriales bacterium]